MDKKSMEFAIFMIHALADEWGKPCGDVYNTLNTSGVLDDYIVRFYDVLHTLGVKYLVDDVTGFVEDRGYQI